MRVSTLNFQRGGVQNILDAQSSMAQTQLQLSRGKRVVQPSDDPVASSQILRFRSEIQLTEQFQRNTDSAETRLSVLEANLGNMNGNLQRVRELLVRSANATMSNSDRQSVAVEIRERLNQLVSIGNYRAANGEYVFGGYQTNTLPITQDAAGNYVYSGDNGQRSLQIGADVRIPVTESGFDVFMDIRTGNGSFLTSATSTNVGTGVLKGGEVTDPTTFVSDTYTVTMVTNSNGDLAYNVFGATGGQIIPALPNDSVNDAPAYTPGTEISFNGMRVVLTGNPIAGDSFTVTPSSRQDIFTTVDDAISALETDVTSDAGFALFTDRINRSLQQVDNAMANVTKVQGRLGARLNIVENERRQNENFIVLSTTSLSQVEDLDMVEAISRLNRERVALEAAQSSFARIQGLTLFTYI